MGKAVDKLDFWKDRIAMAKKNKEHYSVYITDFKDWDRLNTDHEAIFTKEIKKEDRVLDAGCGYGRSSIYFDNYVGVDFSPDFIELAQKKFPDKEFWVADLKDLPFKDQEFDVSFCVSIKHMIVDNLGEEEWNKMFKELKRVSKKVLLLEYTDSKDYESWSNSTGDTSRLRISS